MSRPSTIDTITLYQKDRVISADGTAKLSYWVKNNYQCDTCLLELPYRETPLVICVSTQVGCPFDCSFCAVGLTTFQRTLAEQELLDQILLSRLDPWWGSKVSEPYEVAAMGTGEPMLALPKLIGAIRRAKEQDPALVSLNVATVGIPDKIRKYANENIDHVKLGLQISVHGSKDEQRRYLMPRAADFDLGSIVEAGIYFAKTRNTKVVANYLLIRGVNDSIEDAKRLAALLDPNHFAVKVSALNAVTGGKWTPANTKSLLEFCDWLKSNGMNARVFTSAGVDIRAGCGQFSNLPL